MPYLAQIDSDEFFFIKQGTLKIEKIRLPHFHKFFNLSQSEGVTAFPPIFVKELENKCSEWEMKCSVNGRQIVRRLGEQKFGGNLPQLTRKLSSKRIIFLGHS